jgi:hypothetical protein
MQNWFCDSVVAIIGVISRGFCVVRRSSCKNPLSIPVSNNAFGSRSSFSGSVFFCGVMFIPRTFRDLYNDGRFMCLN